MSEILFIASDPCIRELIDNLQPLVETPVHLETDYTSGVKRIFDNLPAAVFIQRRIGELTCDQLVGKVRMLLEGKAVPVILLSDEEVMSYAVFSEYEACFDLCLPTVELTRQVRQLLQTLPRVAWKGADAQPPLSKESEPETVESSLPAASPPATPISCIDQDGDSDGPGTTTAVDQVIFEVFHPSDPPDAASQSRDSESERVSFLMDDAPLDLFDTEPLPAPPGGDPGQEVTQPAPSLQPAAAAPQKPVTDRGRIEKSDPAQLFGSMSDSSVEPPRTTARGNEPKPVREGGSPAGDRKTSATKNGDRAASAPGPARQSIARGASARHKHTPAGDDLPEAAATALGVQTKATRPYGKLVRCALLLLCVFLLIASLDLFLTSHPVAGIRGISRGMIGNGSAAPAPVSPPPAAEPLPKFIPRVAPDQQYAAGHPGWERYQADELEYLVYREHGRIRAVQVVSRQREAITLPFLNTCIRVSTGQGQHTVQRTELRGSLQVESGTLQNGCEFAVYREAAGGEIRGFVLSFPG